VTSGEDPVLDANLDHGVVVIEIKGDADLMVTHSLRSQLDRLAPDARVVVDLSRADFIDSSMLGALAFSANAFASPPSRFAIVCPPGDVRTMFELTALERVVALRDTRAEALAFVRAEDPSS
jgi:anti-sigma B factor antagonist